MRLALNVFDSTNMGLPNEKLNTPSAIDRAVHGRRMQYMQRVLLEARWLQTRSLLLDAVNRTHTECACATVTSKQRYPWTKRDMRSDLPDHCRDGQHEVLPARLL